MSININKVGDITLACCIYRLYCTNISSIFYEIFCYSLTSLPGLTFFTNLDLSDFNKRIIHIFYIQTTILKSDFLNEIVIITTGSLKYCNYV